MLLPYLDMGNLYLSAQTQKDLGKLDIILNSALRIVYRIRNPRNVHMLDLYTRANLLPLAYRRQYFMLNLVHRLIVTEDIPMYIPQRETRHNNAPLVMTSIALNQSVAKSPVFVARDLWNKLPKDVRSIADHEALKNTIRKRLTETYVNAEIQRLTAGLFR